MISTGKVILGEDNPLIKLLIQSAREFLLKAPLVNEEKLTRLKYAISTLFEDATDMMDTDQLTSTYFLNKLISDIIDYVFLINGTSCPRAKERIKYLELNYPDIGKLIVGYYKTEKFKDRYEIAKSLVGKAIGKYGFFEWDSGRD
jgi:hypothetical protein